MVSHSMEEIASNVDKLAVLNHGKVAMYATPKEVFTHAEELIAMGLAVPQVTNVLLRLKQLGVTIDTSAFTVEQAKEVLLRKKEELRHA